jgi:hypothetical protein
MMRKPAVAILLGLIAMLAPTGLNANEDKSVTLAGRWGHGPCYAVDIADNVVYFGDGGYVVVADFSDPVYPVELGRALTPGVTKGIIVRDDYAYIADGQWGLRVIDVGDHNSMPEVSSLQIGDNAKRLALWDEYALVAGEWSGLCIVDMSDPSSPSQVGYYDSPEGTADVAVNDSFAYVAAWGGGLRILDISDPSTPSEVGSWDTQGYALGIAVEGNHAYVADGSDGLRIIDVTDPSSPYETGCG